MYVQSDLFWVPDSINVQLWTRHLTLTFLLASQTQLVPPYLQLIPQTYSTPAQPAQVMAAPSFLLLRPITSEYILMTFFPTYIQCIRKPHCFHRITYPEWNCFLPGPWLPPSPSHHHLSPGQCLSHVPVSSCCPCHLQFVLLTSAYVYISQNLSYCSEPCGSNPEEKPELEGAPLFPITALPASPFFVSGTMAHLLKFLTSHILCILVAQMKICFAHGCILSLPLPTQSPIPVLLCARRRLDRVRSPWGPFSFNSLFHFFHKCLTQASLG